MRILDTLIIEFAVRVLHCLGRPNTSAVSGFLASLESTSTRAAGRGGAQGGRSVAWRSAPKARTGNPTHGLLFSRLSQMGFERKRRWVTLMSTCMERWSIR